MTKHETFLPQESRHTAQRGQRAACFTSIRDRLAVIVLVAMAPALLFFGLVSVDAYWNALGEANERLANYIEMSVLVQERRVQAAREIATILANTPDIQYRHENFCNIFAQIRQQHSEYANLGLTDAAGNVICSARPIDQPVNCADRPWFREAKATQRLSVDTYHLGHIAKSPVLVIGAPVSPDPGAQAGYVFV
ncbi:MAG: hypothetical protein LAN63_18470, partial [Acidobacteriia bacterium]|nr:hypothetical protein [Terriglobia bacterium]